MAARSIPPRLAVYGSLAPGARHHDQVAHLGGTWEAGMVRGRLFDRGWGAGVGYPGFVADPAGEPVRVMVLESPLLERAWGALDRFEGSEYQRSVVEVELDSCGTVEAAIYELRQELVPD